MLRIYRANYPKLEDSDAVREVVEFAKSKGLEIDPKTLVPCGNIRVREKVGFIGNECVGEREVCKDTSSETQKRIEE